MSEVVLITEESKALISVPPLTLEEDNFALAFIEYGGNVGLAYRAVFGQETENAVAKGQLLLNQANVILRIKSLTETIQESALISMSSHMHELAKIRDLSILTGQMKVAFNAERSRGEVAGLYAKHAPKGGAGGGTAVQVVINNKYDAAI